MTDRYTNEEWKQQIEETQKRVQVDKARKYEVPKVGSRELAKTIDHTLLKLDAGREQIDALCSEARTEGFKVCGFLLCSWIWVVCLLDRGMLGPLF
jgi:deoxyribose-phosphate aldolase